MASSRPSSFTWTRAVFLRPWSHDGVPDHVVWISRLRGGSSACLLPAGSDGQSLLCLTSEESTRIEKLHHRHPSQNSLSPDLQLKARINWVKSSQNSGDCADDPRGFLHSYTASSCDTFWENVRYVSKWEGSFLFQLPGWGKFNTSSIHTVDHGHFIFPSTKSFLSIWKIFFYAYWI